MVEPTPAPPSSPSRAANADIAAVDDAPVSPAAATSPVRLSFAGQDENKRQPSPNRGTKSPKKKQQRIASSSSSPHRRAFAPRRPMAPGNGPSVSALFDTPRPSPTTVVTIDPERSTRLTTIIKSIQSKPLSAKRAILIRRKQPTTTKKKGPKKKPSKPGLPQESRHAVSFSCLQTFIRRVLGRRYSFSSVVFSVPISQM